MSEGTKYLLRFAKLDKLRFIGHLDLMHVFQRAVCRAQLPISYSQGFNPHQIMSFALPLSVGIYSHGEYVEFSLDDWVEPADVMARLNQALPRGLEVLAARVVEKGEKAVAAVVAAAQYKIVFREPWDFRERLQTILALPEIMVEKKTKSGMAIVDARQDIWDVEITDEQCLIATLAAGSSRNLKPDLFVRILYGDIPFRETSVQYTRLDLFKRKDEGYVCAYEKNNH